MAAEMGGNVDRMAGWQGQMAIKGGRLSHNVVLTVGPQDSFSAGVAGLQPRQIQAHFSDDVVFDYGDRTLESKGKISVRGDVNGQAVAFDGENLTLQFNGDQKRIEYLRIEPGADGGKITVKDVQLDNDRGLAAAKPAGSGAEGAANNSAAGSGPTAPAPTRGTPIAAAGTTGGAPTTTSATKPGKPEPPPTVYRLAFGRDVKATLGEPRPGER